MNWNYWLPWRDYPQDDTEDSTYEDEVIERCDHDFEQTTETLGPDLANATIENGYFVVPVNELVEEFCEKCGEPGYQGEANPYDGKWTRVGHHLVFEPAFQMDPDLTVSDALTEPVEADADIVVDKNGKAETVAGEDENRVIVSENQHGEDGAPLVPVQPEEGEDELPYGTTD